MRISPSVHANLPLLYAITFTSAVTTEAPLLGGKEQIKVQVSISSHSVIETSQSYWDSKDLFVWNLKTNESSKSSGSINQIIKLFPGFLVEINRHGYLMLSFTRGG